MIKYKAVALNANKNSDFRNIQKGFGKSAKYVASSIAAATIILNDSFPPAYYVVGGIVNSIISKVLKSIIKQPRPVEANKEGYGMPSSHAQALFYFSTVLSLKSSEYFAFPVSFVIAAVLFSYSLFAWFFIFRNSVIILLSNF
jgi:dolichyldiphosphatase